MNEQLQQFARKTIKDGIVKCNSSQQIFFKRMYSPDNLERPIDEIIDNMDVDRLDWAMQQIKNTLEKNNTDNTDN